MTPEEQRQVDMQEVKIRRVENGFLVRVDGKWFVAADFEAVVTRLNCYYNHPKAVV